MFIKYLDYLSPKVTFYHKGLLAHSSILSGILSIIAIIFIIVIGMYFSYDLIKRKDPNAFYFNSFKDDAGEYQLNSSSLFHFINYINNIKGETINKGIDFTIFNIIGIQVYIDSYINNIKYIGLQNIDYWIYGNCQKDNISKELNDLITYDFYNNCACIKKFYNSTEKKYYEMGESGFIWPKIAHGTYNEKNKLYSIFIQKCDNKIINHLLGEDYSCKSDFEIKKYFDIQGAKLFHLYFLNNYINILNYENPKNKFFYRIESILNIGQYSINDLNFNPSYIRTHNGLILDNIEEDVSYVFDRNDVYISNDNGIDLYMCYMFFLKNIINYYERSYKRVQDVISSIGGINQAITVIAITLNSLYNNFVVLSDTEILLSSSIYFEKRNHKRKSQEYKNSKLKNLEKLNTHKTSDSSKFHIQNPANKNRINKSVNDISKSNNICINNIEEKLPQIQPSYNSVDKLNKLTTNIKDYNSTSKPNYKSKNKNEKNFWNFLLFKLTCGKKKNVFEIYKDFRIKIISEEHIIRNHLNIYNLLKFTEKKRHLKRTNSYHLKELIQFV